MEVMAGTVVAMAAGIQVAAGGRQVAVGSLREAESRHRLAAGRFQVVVPGGRQRLGRQTELTRRLRSCKSDKLESVEPERRARLAAHGLISPFHDSDSPVRLGVTVTVTVDHWTRAWRLLSSVWPAVGPQLPPTGPGPDSEKTLHQRPSE